MGIVILLALIACFGADAGVIWDDPVHAEYGDRVLRWFSSGFTDRGATDYLELYLYGGLFEAAAQWVAARSPLGLYETRHLLTAIMALAGVVSIGAAAARIGGARAGFMAGALLALTPAWVGHGLLNSKDVPFGALAAAATFASVRIATGPVPIRWRDTLLAGLTVGLALAVRPGGIFILAYPFLAAAAAIGVEFAEARHVGRPGDSRRGIGLSIVRLLPVAPLAWLLMLSAWPWAQLAPWSRPFEGMAAARHFQWDGEMLFAGAMVRARMLPLSYLPTWFAITSPEFYVVALLLGLVAVFAGRSRIALRSASGAATLAMTIAVPAAGVLYTRPVLYDGLRHFLFLFPPLAALAGLALDAFLSVSRIPRAVRAIGATVVALACALTVADMVALHPYEYVHFNRAFGRLPSAIGRYETDYWGASYKEGLAWVVNELPTLNPGQPTRVASCNDNSNLRLEYYRQRWAGAAEKIVITREYRVADVYLAVTRYDCHKRPGEILHVVERQGAPLLYVIRTVPRP